MKRLQLRHHDEIFESRSLALEFFNNIVDLSHTASTVFGKSLYAEPMVAKYFDSEGNVQLLFALGVDSPNAPYHIIDSKEIHELILANKDAIEEEVKRATAIEAELSGNITTEIETVSNSLGERISDLNGQINSEISTINSRLDEEIINRQSAIDSVNQNIINSIAIETQNREAAITLVNSKIDTEIVDRNKDINDVKTLINNEVKSREDEDNKILETLRHEIENAKTESILESTTSAVTTAVSEATKIATEVASESIAKIVDGASSSYDTLKEIADWIINDTTGSAQMANDIQTLKVDTNNLKAESSVNTNNINTLTNDVNTLKNDSLKVNNDITVINEKITTLSGSVKDTVISNIDDAIIDNGLYITDVKPEDYQSGSLLRKLLYDGKTYFYASSKAEDMTLTNNLGTTVNLRDYIISLQETNNSLNSEIVSLNTTIKSLDDKVCGLTETIKSLNGTIEDLQEQIDDLRENGSDNDSVNEDQVKDIIKNYLQGVTNEIQISESKDKLTIGFADDAIFG